MPVNLQGWGGRGPDFDGGEGEFVMELRVLMERMELMELI